MAASKDTYYTYATPHGPVTLRSTAQGLAEVVFSRVKLSGDNGASEVTNRAANELQEFLAGKRRSFTVPLDLQGSAFQKEVWAKVCEIAYGETRTATDVAAALGKPGAYRSVGSAVRANRLAPFIPTHRIDIPNATGTQASLLRAFSALEKRAVHEGKQG